MYNWCQLRAVAQAMSCPHFDHESDTIESLSSTPIFEFVYERR